MRRILTLLIVLLVAAANATAFARGSGGKGHSGGRHISGAHTGSHRHGGPRVGIGVILAAPARWYSSPAPYYPPVVVAPSAPQVYIEQGDAASAPDRPAGYWYYCAEAQAYYPYVNECAGTWQQVAPQVPQGQ